MHPQFDEIWAAHAAGYIGHTHEVKFLTSETGKLLNGRKCIVVGHSNCRLEVRMLDDGKEYRLHSRNLMPIGRRPSTVPSGPPLADKEVVRHLRDALASFDAKELRDPGERLDWVARGAYVRPHVQAGRLPPPSACMDFMVPPERHVGMIATMAPLLPCCAGDGQVDFTRFNFGLQGAGEACAVCLEQVGSGAPALGMPCGHLFHKACAAKWLESNKTCPTCRHELGMPGREMVKDRLRDANHRLAVRFREWFVSGMCERCQAQFHESDPMLSVAAPDGSTTLVPRSQLPQDLDLADDGARIPF